jgi:hypothetical protein
MSTKKERADILDLLGDQGLRYDEMHTVPSAQTERRGGAGPVRDLLDG